MPVIYFLLSIFGFHCLAQTIQPGASPNDQLSFVTIVKRDGPAVPTITLNSKEAYASTVANPPKVDGTEIQIVIRTDSTNGVDVYVPPSLQSQMASAIKTQCSSPRSDKCQNAVQAVLQPGMAALQKRLLVTGAAVGVAVVGLTAAVVFISILVLAGAVAHAYLSHDDLAQISSAQGASTVAYITKAGDPSPLTAKPTSTAIDTALAATVSIAADSNNGHNKGDIFVLVPKSLGAGLVETILGQVCRKRDDINCFGFIAGGVLEHAGQGGPFEGLLLAIPQLPRDPIAAIAQYLPIIIESGKNILSLVPLDSKTVSGLAAIVALIVYAIRNLNENTKAPVTEFSIPASATAATQSQGSGACPPASRAPDCRHCGGNSATSLFCDGIKTAGDHYKGCECFDAHPFHYQPFKDGQDFNDAVALLKKISEFKGTPAPSATKESAGPPALPTTTVIGPPYAAQFGPLDGRYDIGVTLFRNPPPYRIGDPLFQ